MMIQAQEPGLTAQGVRFDVVRGLVWDAGPLCRPALVTGFE